MLNVPSSEALTAMIVAAELGSLSAAADELGLTHGAVSRRIQGLESWFGQPLFERHGRGVTLTPAGEIFARSVERSLSAIETVATDLRANTRRDLVRLSVLPSVARLWVVPRIVALHGTPSDLVVALSGEHRLASVEAREADVAIRSGAGDWPGLDVRPLFEETVYPLACPAIAARLATATPDDLLHETLLHDGKAGGWRRWFNANGTTFRPAGGERRFDDYDLALGAAAAGLGIVLGRHPLSADLERTGALVRLPGEAIAGKENSYVVLRPNETREAVLRLVERILATA